LFIKNKIKKLRIKMEKKGFDLVRTILRSPIFLTYQIDQQRAVLNQILETGEITKEELVFLISEEAKIQKQLESSNNNEKPESNRQIRELLNLVDYNTFLTMVTAGQIRGKHLIALCNSSKKLNGYCNRSFQPVNAEGSPVPGLMI
jgi:hypothetical protein